MQTLPDLEVVRAVALPVRTQRAEGVDAPAMPTMEVRFSRFGTWYEIDSFWEGRFLECTEKGAFAKTIAESRDQVRVLFNHGYDPSIGDKILGSIEELSEETDSPVGTVPLFDTSYNRDLLPGLEAGVYGSSFRMRVIKDEWNDEPGRSDHNPDGIPERTIKEVRLFEFGPVTWPANPDSTAGLRSVTSMTDAYIERLRARDPGRVDELTRARDSHLRTLTDREPAAATPAPAGAARSTDAEPGPTHSRRIITPGERRARLYNLT